MKDYVSMKMITEKFGKIMNEENEWDHLIKAYTVEGPIEKVTLIEIV